MSLVTARSYGSPRRQGKTKELEQAGDWKRLLEHMIKLSQAHGHFEEVERLRKQLNPERVQTITEPEPEPVKPVRIQKRKSPTPSSPDKRLREAWRVLDAKRGRGD